MMGLPGSPGPRPDGSPHSGNRPPHQGRTSAPLSQPAGRSWSIIGLIVTCVGASLGVIVGLLGLSFAGFTLITGAPPHVWLSALRFSYLVGLPFVGSFALIGAVLSLIGRRRARAAGETRGQGLAMAGLVTAAVCGGGVLLGLPLVFVESCFDLSCN